VTPTPAQLRAYVEAQSTQAAAGAPDVPFTRAEYAERLARLRAAMAERELDVLLVSSPEGMCWLHGYRARWYRTQSSTRFPPLATTVVHVDHDAPAHFDFVREEALVRATSIAQDVRMFPAGCEGLDGAAFLARALDRAGWLPGRVGLELWSPVPNRAVSEAFEAALVRHGARPVDATRIVRGVRRVKSPAELAYVEEAARIADLGIEAARAALVPGASELEVWAEMMRAMVAAGGEPAAIHELVHAGALGGGHALSTRRALRAGDLALADPCGVVHRYHANVARAFVLGEPAPEALRLLELAAGAVDVLCAVASAGTPQRDVNGALRDYYREQGIWELRTWAGGYELGISMPPDWVGESVFSVDEEDPEGVVEAGTVTSFHSNFQLPFVDTVVFGEGGARTLSRLPPGPLVAG
jgi:Xaa-Pro aminopeptidase